MVGMSWEKAYLETRVLSAAPVELISILYEYATLAIEDARSRLAQGDIPGRSKAIQKAIAILGELESSLDYELGGEIATNLGRLYAYMREQLTQANIRQADGPLAEVEALLATLGEAWQAIAREKNGTTKDYAGMPTDMNAFALTESMPDFGAHAWSA
jgi:flagellar protein FliS